MGRIGVAIVLGTGVGFVGLLSLSLLLTGLVLTDMAAPSYRFTWQDHLLLWPWAILSIGIGPLTRATEWGGQRLSEPGGSSAHALRSGSEPRQGSEACPQELTGREDGPRTGDHGFCPRWRGGRCAGVDLEDPRSPWGEPFLAINRRAVVS